MNTEATIFELGLIVNGNDWIGQGFKADSERTPLASLATDYEQQVVCLFL